MSLTLTGSEREYQHWQQYDAPPLNQQHLFQLVRHIDKEASIFPPLQFTLSASPQKAYFLLK